MLQMCQTKQGQRPGTYCRVPAGRGLCKTTMAPGHNETRAINHLVRTKVDLV